MNEEQMVLFMPPQQRHRRRRPEDPVVFEAVQRLRRSGRQVYAAGYAHQVDGKLLSTPQLLEAAASLPQSK